MEEYKDISRGLKMLLDKAEEMGWNWEAYIEPGSRRTYVEIGQSSPAGEDFSMVIDFDEENQADSFKDSLESYYEDFDIDEHIEMWIEAKRSGTSGVPSTRELVKDAEAIDGMILELSQALKKVNIPVLVGSYTPPDENGEGEKIVREFYGQGHIFKDEDAFYHRPDDPCYIPELSDTVYTRNSILQECNQQDDLAEEVFKALDWQHVSSLLEDWQRNGELDTCKECGKMFNCYGATKCPYCGADYEGERVMGGKEKEKQVTVSVTLEIVLTQEDIDDIMCGALEGGITYWCDEAKVVGDYLGEYGSEQIARGGKLRLHLPEPFDKDETEYYELDLEKFKKGVELWAITPVGCNCLEQMDGKIRFDTCNADAIVCDAIIQYALFGTVVFG